jgi:hypothetical protein
MSADQPDPSAELHTWPIELLRIVEPDEATRLSTLSWDSIRRNHFDKIIHLSKRRVGMRVGHALMLAQVSECAAATKSVA